jgi:hypothetical protein
MERALNATVYSPELLTTHYASRPFKARAPSRIPSIPRSYVLCASASLSQQIDHNPTTKGARRHEGEQAGQGSEALCAGVGDPVDRFL